MKYVRNVLKKWKVASVTGKERMSSIHRRPDGEYDPEWKGGLVDDEWNVGEPRNKGVPKWLTNMMDKEEEK